jgi:hypothetical protein
LPDTDTRDVRPVLSVEQDYVVSAAGVELALVAVLRSAAAAAR